MLLHCCSLVYSGNMYRGDQGFLTNKACVTLLTFSSLEGTNFNYYTISGNTKAKYYLGLAPVRHVSYGKYHIRRWSGSLVDMLFW